MAKETDMKLCYDCADSSGDITDSEGRPWCLQCAQLMLGAVTRTRYGHGVYLEASTPAANDDVREEE